MIQPDDTAASAGSNGAGKGAAKPTSRSRGGVAKEVKTPSSGRLPGASAGTANNGSRAQRASGKSSGSAPGSPKAERAARVPEGSRRRAERAPGTPTAPGGRQARSPDVMRPEIRYLNRELARLDFNARVLSHAEDRDLPVLERAKFLAIFSQNLDELFQVRVAALHEQVMAGSAAHSPDGLAPQAQLARVRERAEALVERRSRIFREVLVPDLDAAGIRFSQWKDLDDGDRAHLDGVFER
ncbi:MAG TPA: hypothetical protein VKY26_11235, partial [Actinomycetota bacterium]|nr:hypothetical protein [Actinomycetota bacterium]